MPPTERLVAILKSSDVKRTMAWYTRAGFDVRGSHPVEMPTWCELARDNTVFRFLEGATPWEGEPNLTGCLYIPTNDVDAVYEEIRHKVDCEWGIEEREWGARELVLRDPDGYFITFTQ
ncbi:MAG TPA: VOC family protein [Acidimicrobiia bacterium]|nr:VOC family protein [Acidimicrobiia bacterium]